MDESSDRDGQEELELDSREDTEIQDAEQDDTELREKGEKALRHERKRARTYRAELVKAGYSFATDGTPIPPRTSDAKPDVDADVVRAQVEAEWTERLVLAEAVSELNAAGIKGNARRAARMLDLDTVSVHDGKVDLEALRDAIEELKSDSPVLFKRSRNRDDDDDSDEEQNGHVARRRVESADFGRREPASTQKTTADAFSSFRKQSGY